MKDANLGSAPFKLGMKCDYWANMLEDESKFDKTYSFEQRQELFIAMRD